MTDNAKKFLEFVSKNEEAKKELEANKASFTTEDNTEALVKFAAKHGFALTAEDFQETEIELSEDELEAVAGGGCGTDQFDVDARECHLIHGIF